MPQITLAQAETKLSEWLAADEKVATGQSYSISGRALTRADAAEIRKNIVFWNEMVGRLSGTGGMKITGVTPCV
jgi:hypothetical protein